MDADDKFGIRIGYDYLILATGATHSYFGHDEFAAFAPGLKSLSDAESLRNHLLAVFEKAEIEDDPDRRRALMTFVMVGAGPTGVPPQCDRGHDEDYIPKRLPPNRSEVSAYRACGYGNARPRQLFPRSSLKPRGCGGVAWR